MAVRHFAELIAWQLSEALRVELMAVSARADDARDYRLRDQLRASALSAPANIAEGFGRYAHGDFARFCDIAIGSLSETESHLKVARHANYVSAADYKALLFLIRRARLATIRLKAYLRTSPTPR
jgi:four helix bundle protein